LCRAANHRLLCVCRSGWNTAATAAKAKAAAEKNDKQKKANLSFNQREKRKRDSGQSERGKSYVEGELRREVLRPPPA
jgi:hypothetical protein